VDYAKNPTSYIFNRRKYALKIDVLNALGGLKYRDMMLSYLGSSLTPMDTLDIFYQEGNSDDFYLSSSKAFIGKSFVYKRGNEPLDYAASFHIQLNAVDSAKTEVIITTVKPRVVVGKEFWPQGPHFVRPLLYKNVPPSTIEEYEILLKIGGETGEKNMPTIIYPK
jgi:hypothetical protein